MSKMMIAVAPDQQVLAASSLPHGRSPIHTVQPGPAFTLSSQVQPLHSTLAAGTGNEVHVVLCAGYWAHLSGSG